jgi:hypothetical protein
MIHLFFMAASFEPGLALSLLSHALRRLPTL